MARSNRPEFRSLYRIGLLALGLLPVAVHAAGPETWAAIKSTGGLEIGAPFHSADGWLLRVRARLSKLLPPKNVTAPDGGLSCKSTQAVVEGDKIFLTIISGEPRGPLGAVCPAARLGEIAPGHYKVFYRDPNGVSTQLREVEVAR